ncbi:collagen alpha-1(XI) chain [Drosophila hydei]|uniref:Collagen alpha-1(XI) chain n=1 Tax=Drosophila hydei TaxID=7224 RepID=A0A6J1MCP9_DROHY|nr:collagen alpha-1(XI) chain [Drosophila hydei]
MLAMPWTTWPLVLMLVVPLHLVNADVSHLSSNYLPPDPKPSAAKILADEPAPAEPVKAADGAFYPSGGLMLPSGYSIPTGSNVPPPPMTPPNFPLPIYPPFFGFGGGGGGDAFGTGAGQVPPGYEAQFNNVAQGPQFPQAGPFPIGPQPGQFPVGPQGAPFSAGQQGLQFMAGPQGGGFPVGPQGGGFPVGPQGGGFPVGPQGGGFPVGPQGGGFPVGPQGGGFPVGPQGGGFPVGPQGGGFPVGSQGGGLPIPDYLTMQGLPASAMQLAFQQNVGFGPQPGFAGPQPTYPFQQLVNVGQPFSPSFGIPGQNYQPQPQPFADEPQPESNVKPKSTAAKALAKSHNMETVYAPNGGYIYKRAK